MARGLFFLTIIVALALCASHAEARKKPPQKKPVPSPKRPVPSPKKPVPSPKKPAPSPKKPVPSPKKPYPSPADHGSYPNMISAIEALNLTVLLGLVKPGVWLGPPSPP